MPRPPRQIDPDLAHHLTARGTARGPIVLDDLDRAGFMALLDLTAERFAWRCLAYCLMDNHFHLIVEADRSEAVSLGMKLLTGVHAQRFNRRHDRVGHLFQGRFHAAPIDREAHLVEALRYVALNPVRAGICGHPADWPWSSYPASAGRRTPRPCLAVDRLHALMEAYAPTGAAAYADLVERPLPRW